MGVEQRAVARNALAVHHAAAILHRGKHGGKRHFNIHEQRVLPTLAQLLRQGLIHAQRVKRERQLRLVNLTKIRNRQAVGRIASLPGIVHPRSKHDVKIAAVPIAALRRQRAINGFAVVADHLLICKKGLQRGKVARIFEQMRAVCQNGNTVCIVKADQIARKVGKGCDMCQIRAGIGCDRGICNGFLHNGNIRYGRVVLIQPETLDKARKLQARKHLSRCSAVKSRVGKIVQRHMQRHLAANARKRLRKVRAVLAVFQLGAHRGGMLGGG